MRRVEGGDTIQSVVNRPCENARGLRRGTMRRWRGFVSMMMRGQGYGRMGGGGYRRMMNNTMEPPSKKADWRTVRRVAAAFVPYRREVSVVLLAIVVVAVLGIVNPLMLKYAIAIGFGQQRFDLL